MEPNADQSLSDEEEVFPQQTNNEQTQMDPQEEAASKLLQAEEQIQRNEGKISILSQDIESKLQQLFQDIKEDDGSNFQSAISLRMKELAYNKILVLTYERSYFRLVLAHFHIAKQYLRFKCYEQTISHIEQTISKNTKAALNRDNKLFHSYLFTYLAICLYHTKKIEQAQAEISKAINLQQQYEMNERVSLPNFKTLVYNAKIKAELKHADALENMKDAVSKAQKYYENRKGQSLGLILYQYGKICLSLNKKQEAIRNYERAIQTIKMGNSPGHEEQIINIYYQLAEIYKNTNNEEYINILKLKYQVFEDTYGNSDKKSIIEQRNLAKAYLQQKKIEESLQEFEDILDKEKKVYGQNSIQVGKQLKSIANIYLAKHDNKQAIIHFKKALKIFHDLGDQRLARQIRMRLTALQAQQPKH